MPAPFGKMRQICSRPPREPTSWCRVAEGSARHRLCTPNRQREGRFDCRESQAGTPTPAELKQLGPTLFPGAPLHYDPMPVLRNLQIPQLWILGKDDIDAPSAETAARLKALARSGSPITTAVFPGAEHGMYEYEVAPDSTRLSPRQPEGYFKMMVDFFHDGRLHGPYGAEIISNPRPGKWLLSFSPWPHQPTHQRVIQPQRTAQPFPNTWEHLSATLPQLEGTGPRQVAEHDQAISDGHCERRHLPLASQSVSAHPPRTSL
jgi:hypothetical protein